MRRTPSGDHVRDCSRYLSRTLIRVVEPGLQHTKKVARSGLSLSLSLSTSSFFLFFLFLFSFRCPGNSVRARSQAETRSSSKSPINCPGVSCKDNSCCYDYELVNGPCSTMANVPRRTGERHPPYNYTLARTRLFGVCRRGDASASARHDTIAPRLFSPN